MKHIKHILSITFMILSITIINGQYRGQNIQSKNLSNKTFKYGDFYGAKAYSANFQGSNILNADFQGADLRNTTFTGANISESYFYGSDLKNSKMIGAMADGANFEGADMHKGQFDGSSFRCTRFYGTSLNTANCKNCDFSGANLDRADLRAADLSGSKFTKANITANTLIDSNTKGLPPKYLWGKGYKANTKCSDLLKYPKKPTNTIDKKMTNFSPDKHGFKFGNRGFKPYILDARSISIDFSGFCGGMTYAAGDYYYKNIPRPNQDYTPAPGTKLYEYISSRQEKSIENIAGQVIEFHSNILGNRNAEFWRWAVNEKLRQLVNNIDAGKPTPILMLRIGKDMSDNHWVMAIGYDLGGYKWGKENDPNVNNIKIFIADPNCPGDYMVLMPRKEKWDLKYGWYDMKKNEFIREKQGWNCLSFHPNTNFHKSVTTPPRIENLRTGGSDLVYQLVAKFNTGDSHLRGGNDNVNILVKYKDGRTEYFRNVNKSQKWSGGSISNVELKLKQKVKSEQITCIKISTNFRGGINGSNWNLDSVSITAYKENGEKENLQSYSGKPWKRFTGDKKEEWICTRYTNANVELR